MKQELKVYRGTVVLKKGTTKNQKEKKKLFDRFVKEEGLYLNPYYMDRAFELWQKEKLTIKRLIKAIPKLKTNTDPNKATFTDGKTREAWLKEVRRPVIGIDATGKETVYPSVCDAIKGCGGTNFSGINYAIRTGGKAYGLQWRYVDEETPAKTQIGFSLN